MKNKRIKIFIGSSSESLPVAEAIQQNLDAYFLVTLWNQGFFSIGSTTLNSLVDNAINYDFVIIVLSGDDTLRYRKENFVVPRDNLLFELGFYFGKIGIHRTFFVYDISVKLKLPSDLAGYTGATYHMPDSKHDLQSALGKACTNIKLRIEQLGPRQKTFTITSEVKIDIYYHASGFTKDDADSLVSSLKEYKFQIRVLKHDFKARPDAIFIGCLIKADVARLVIEKINYPIKYIFRLDYPESEGGDVDGLKIGIGYSSSYNSKNRSLLCEPVKISNLQLQRLTDVKLSNTDFHMRLYKFLKL